MVLFPEARSIGWQWMGGAGGGACCTSCPSARFGSLQALLLSFSHPCSWAFYTFPLRTAIFLPFTVIEEGMEISVESCHRQPEALRQLRFV